MSVINIPFSARFNSGHRTHAAEYKNNSVSENWPGRGIHSTCSHGPIQFAVLGISGFGGNGTRADKFEAALVFDHGGCAVCFFPVTVVSFEVIGPFFFPNSFSRFLAETDNILKIMAVEMNNQRIEVGNRGSRCTPIVVAL